MAAAVELNERQITCIKAVGESAPCSAKVVADALSPGSDSRGAAQTMRRMTTYIVKTDDGYKLTDAGRAKLRRIRVAEQTPFAAGGTEI